MARDNIAALNAEKASMDQETRLIIAKILGPIRT